MANHVFYGYTFINHTQGSPQGWEVSVQSLGAERRDRWEATHNRHQSFLPSGKNKLYLDCFDGSTTADTLKMIRLCR